MILLAAAAAIQLASGRSASDIAQMAAFFTALGDNLALLLAEPGLESNDQS